MKSEVRPPYISRTISSRPRRPSAPRKNLPPASNQTGPIGLPSGVTTSRFSPSTVIFSSVWVVVRPGVGDVVRPQRRRQDEDDDQDEEAEEGERDAVAAQPPQARHQGLRPGDAPRRPRRVGLGGHAAYCEQPLGLLLELEAGQVLAEGRVEDDLVEVDRARRRRSTASASRRAPTAPVPCIRWSSSAYSASCFGPELFFAELGDFRVQLRVVDVGEVVVVGRQDAFAGQQRLEEVVRVRVVLEPVDPAGVEVGRRSRCRSP